VRAYRARQTGSDEPPALARALDDGDELADQYGDMDLGTVDAAVIAIAERLNVTTLATINPRDFRVVRPAHCDAFELDPTR